MWDGYPSIANALWVVRNAYLLNGRELFYLEEKEEKLLNLCNSCEIGNRLRQLSFTPNSFLRS